jgi:hypothetical protein
MSIDPISSKKALESMTGIDRLEHEDPQRDALDREELRAVEYRDVGLRAPARQPRTGLLARLERLLGRRR